MSYDDIRLALRISLNELDITLHRNTQYALARRMYSMLKTQSPVPNPQTIPTEFPLVNF